MQLAKARVKRVDESMRLMAKHGNRSENRKQRESSSCTLVVALVITFNLVVKPYLDCFY